MQKNEGGGLRPLRGRNIRGRTNLWKRGITANALCPLPFPQNENPDGGGGKSILSKVVFCEISTDSVQTLRSCSAWDYLINWNWLELMFYTQLTMSMPWELPHFFSLFSTCKVSWNVACNVTHHRAERGWVSCFLSLFLRFGERRLPILGRYHRGYEWSYPISRAYIVVCCIIVFL